MPPEVYDGKPAKVAERLLKLKEKAAGHPILKAIGRGVIKFFKWIVATAFVLVLATIGTYLLENTWLRPISRIKNVIHNIENNLERKELDEFTKQRQREEFKAKQKADEQKRLEEKKQDSLKNAQKKLKNKKNRQHSFYGAKEELHQTEFRFRTLASRVQVNLPAKNDFTARTETNRKIPNLQ